ncbi:MAG: topoisomerase DNA-binding C4 zinc finger domain-containing protein, partial [Parvularculaceae bacterium]|nr:topoisomerase DNA-binding C4 zinc finger domain-containing protein [Parvularculaceae bacterium]
APLIFPDKGDGADPRGCPSCADGRLSLKAGKFGAFIGCSNYPTCNFTRQLSAAEADPQAADKLLGHDPEENREVWLKTGRFGPYVQLNALDKDEKPKRSGLPKGWKPEEMDLERALKLLALPRPIGPHPEDGETIEAGLGRFGPYVRHGKTYASLPGIEDAFEIGLNRAVAVLAEKKANPRFGRGAAQKPIREIGVHAATGEAVVVMDGRYGAYVKSGKINATIPKGTDFATLTLEQAQALLAEREAKGGGKKPARKAAAKKEAPAKPAAKKTAAKKTAAKKPAAKKAPALKKASAS